MAPLSLVKRTFAKQITRRQLRLIAAEHKGVSAARNAGLDAATGDIIAYLDSDNTWRPEYLAHVAAAFARHPNALSVYADFLMHDADRGCTETYRQDYDRAALLHRNFIDLNVFSHDGQSSSRANGSISASSASSTGISSSA